MKTRAPYALSLLLVVGCGGGATGSLDCSNVGTSDPEPHTLRGSFSFDRCR